MKKYRIGFDLGIGSVGHTLLEFQEDGKVKILSMGSRIIPMGSDKIDYEKGQGISKNAERRLQKGIRKSNKRFKQRRNKLIYILDKLGMLPEQIVLKNGIPEAKKIQHLEILPITKGTMQLDSVTFLAMRVNALNKPMADIKDFGKILYRFNQLRGYSGGDNYEQADVRNYKKEEDEEEDNRKYRVEIAKVDVTNIEKLDSTFKYKNQDLNKYELTIIWDGEEITGETKLQDLELGEKELELRIKTNKKKEKSYEFALPRKTNWRKQMEATEELLTTQQKFISELLLEDLTSNKSNKIRNRVFLRNRYKDEFDKIWDTQSKKFDILNNCPRNILEEIANYLFPGQSATQVKLKQQSLEGGLKYIIKEQIIYYQRPLKSQTDLIRQCQFEDSEKVIANSHPDFQYFRCWDQINRLYITSKKEVFDAKKNKTKYQYHDRFLTKEQKNEIYNKLQIQKQVGFNDVAKIVALKNDKSEYLNGLHVKAKLKGCDTIISINKILKQFGFNEKQQPFYSDIWTILYNKTGNEYDIHSEKLSNLIDYLKAHFDYSTAEKLALELAQKIKFPRRYANLSLKAIANIVSLMKLSPADVPQNIKSNFENVLRLIQMGEITNELIAENYIINFVKDNPNAINEGGLMYSLAASLIYGKHTAKDVKKEIKDYHDIQYVSNRGLRNPVVEQLMNETMQITKALWKKFNLNADELEFRVELARDLKNSAAERENIFKAQLRNKKGNDAVKEILTSENIPLTDENILKYKLYKQQNLISPYSLKTMKISLFNEYEIDHIIPKSRYFADSISNKVLVEWYLNKEKGNRTAWEYISAQNSQHKIADVETYLAYVNENYFGKKKHHLLMEKIPNNLIDRSLKDTQYISVAVKNELAKIVGSENVKTTTGEVTAFLRGKWGLRELLMRLTEERFRRMELWDWDNEKDAPNVSWVNKYFDTELNKNIYSIKNWNKRYDHRHHAIDALVVALTEQGFIQRLNNLNKELQEWLETNKDRVKLNVKEDETVLEAFFNLKETEREIIQKQIPSFQKIERPIHDLIAQAQTHLETMIVSHKKKDKIDTKIDPKGKKQLKIRAALHEATYYGKTNGIDTKTIDISQLSAKDISKIIDRHLANEIDAHRKKYDTIREAFTGEGLITFNETRFQKKNSDKLKPPVHKVKIRYSNKETEESTLKSLYGIHSKKSVVTGDNYLFVVMQRNSKKDLPERVFDIASLFDSADIARAALKEGKENFKEIICESMRLTWGERNKIKDISQNPTKVLFSLQQNDLVYMPSEDDLVLNMTSDEFDEWIVIPENKKQFSKQVYKVVKFTGKDCFFLPHNIANPINVPRDLSKEKRDELKQIYKDKTIPKTELNYQEFSSFGNCLKVEHNDNFVKNIQGKEKQKERKIQDYCIKIETDWLGQIKIFK